MPQLLLGAMLHEIIGDAHALHLSRIAIISRKFKYCTSEASLDHPVFHSDDFSEAFHDAVQYLLVKGVGKTHVIVKD